MNPFNVEIQVIEQTVEGQSDDPRSPNFGERESLNFRPSKSLPNDLLFAEIESGNSGVLLNLSQAKALRDYLNRFIAHAEYENTRNKLVSDAAVATEIFDPDELEAFARNKEKK